MTFKEWYAGHDFEKTPNLEDDLRDCWDASHMQALAEASLRVSESGEVALCPDCDNPMPCSEHKP